MADSNLRVYFDIECNGLDNPTEIWLIVAKDMDTAEYHIFRNVTSNPFEKEKFLEFSKEVTLWVGHHILGYDVPVLRRLVPCSIDTGSCKDTLICSKLVDYSRTTGHSVESYGEEFGFEKGQFYKWTDPQLHNINSILFKELEKYCVRDVDIVERIYSKYHRIWSDPVWQPALDLEQQFQGIINNLHTNGFSFNVGAAKKLLEKVTKELGELDANIKIAFPPKTRKIREWTPKLTKFDTISRTSIPRGIEDLSSYSEGHPFSTFSWEEFNPSSHKQLIEVLAGAGWQPVDKTQTHTDTERELQRLKYSRNRDNSLDIGVKMLQDKILALGRSGWKISENNLGTLISRDKCLIKILKNEEHILADMIKRLPGGKREEFGERNTIELTKNSEIKLKPGLVSVTIKIQEFLRIANLEEITEFLSKILNRCLKNKMDVAEFVKNGSCSWSIIVMPQDLYVDFSASYAMDILDGMKDLTPRHQTILESLKGSFYEAPAPSRLLAKRILLESRRRTLTEWLGLVSPTDGRIHGRFYGIGAWTHRMAHQQPNTANIPNEVYISTGKPKLLGKEMRQLWCAPKGRLLVGVDAEAIQLRVFAHLIDDAELTDAIVNGKKSDGTDPHSLNRKVFGPFCKTRNAAKHSLYAIFFGGRANKIMQIMACTKSEAQEGIENLIERYPGLARLEKEVFPQDARRGYFVGLDGRKVKIPDETISGRKHLCMSGYLQNGEKIIMARATLKWEPKLKDYDSILVNLVHDEWVTECPNNVGRAIEVAKMMADSLVEVGEDLKLKCPLAGSYFNADTNDYTVGTTWYAVH